MDPRHPLRPAATPDGLPGEMLAAITAPVAPPEGLHPEGDARFAEMMARCPVDGLVLPWPVGHALAAATVASMARRGLVACADVWTEVGAVWPVEAGPAYVVRESAEGPVAGSPEATGAAHPSSHSVAPSGASGGAGLCRVLPEPFGPAWAVLAARALDGAGLLRTPYAEGGDADAPDRLASDAVAFLVAALTDAGLYARILGALLSTLGTPEPAVSRALRHNADDSTWTRGEAWRTHAPIPGLGPRGLHPVAALFLAWAGRPTPARGLPAGLSLPPVRPRRP